MKDLITEMSVNKWIPVEEALPENDRDVLITVIDHDCDDDVFVEYGFYFDVEEGYEWHIYTINGAEMVFKDNMEVIAWMEHPEPYKKGANK